LRLVFKTIHIYTGAVQYFFTGDFMHIRRVLVDNVNLDEGTVLTLSPQVSHHLTHVLRLGDGDAVILCDCAGGEARGVIESILQGGVRVRIMQRCDPPAGGCELTMPVALALPYIKSDKLEMALRMASELGASAFYIFHCRRCVPGRIESAVARKKERWRDIVRDAVRLSGRTVVPEIFGPFSFEEIMDEITPRYSVILPYEGGGYPRISEVLQGLYPEGERGGTKVNGICLVTGPEGGFEPDEIEAAKGHGALICSLGARILRAETAPIAAMCATLAMTGEM
jgi:16S rRNA (uracil1498-N3)-methyltransferase